MREVRLGVLEGVEGYKDNFCVIIKGKGGECVSDIGTILEDAKVVI